MSKAEQKKIRVGILFGGRSAEHEISLQSANNIIRSINKDRYEVIPIGITKKGEWLTSAASKTLLSGAMKQLTAPLSAGSALTRFSPKTIGSVDVIFPVLHGT